MDIIRDTARRYKEIRAGFREEKRMMEQSGRGGRLALLLPFLFGQSGGACAMCGRITDRCEKKSKKLAKVLDNGAFIHYNSLKSI